MIVVIGAAIIIVCEIILAFIFSVTAQIFYKKIGLDFRSIIKGFIERVFLMIFLYNDYAAALTLYSALKLGTRLKHEESEARENKFNDYYLIGNLVSVTVALMYVYMYKNIHLLERLVN